MESNLKAVSGIALLHQESSSARGSSELVSNYQARDLEIVDYEMYRLDRTALLFRGPRPESLANGDYFTCIGGAQTFGCFCENPYPRLLGKELGLPALNLGYGGAGPEFFNRRNDLDDYLNNGRFVVVQAMSGRSQSNSMFYCGGLEIQVRRSDGHSMGSDSAYEDLLSGPPWLRSLSPRQFGSKIARIVRRPLIRRILRETRTNWIESHRQWFSRIKVPIVFLWFSTRTPAYVDSVRSRWLMFGEFPQMIDAASVNEVRKLAGDYVECVSKRGSPQQLLSRFTGEPCAIDPANDRADLRVGGKWTHNRYYPSPEMHQDAFKALIPVCKRLC